MKEYLVLQIKHNSLMIEAWLVLHALNNPYWDTAVGFTTQAQLVQDVSLV